MRRAAVPFGAFTVLVLIGPALGMSGPLPPAPELLALPPAAEEALVAVVDHRPAAQAVRALTPPPAPTAREQTSPTAPGTTRRAAPHAASRSRTHTVEEGDTLWNISRRYGITVDDLVRANNMAPDDVLRLGRALSIPAAGAAPAATASAARPTARTASAGRTVNYIVQPGDTLWSVAARHGTTVEAIMARNDLDDPERIKAGQRLVISGRELPRHRQVGAAPAAAPRMADPLTLRAAGEFLWPSRGLLTSRFGLRYRRHHDGIDIAAPHGTPIYASRDGIVEFAGWRQGYGRAVMIGHGEGLVTLYGHASRVLVAAGQAVKKGQLIAYVGCTGRCTGSHLHFEVRINGRAQNPLQYLR